MVDFLIVTALEEETQALLYKMPELRKVPPDNEDVRVYFSGSLPFEMPDGIKGSYRVVIVPLLGMGRVEAATATGDAIRRWKPRYVLMVGIAGGIAANGASLGDIVVADQIFDYELQKITQDGAQLRPRVYGADPRLLGAVKSLGGSRWQKTPTKRPKAGAAKRRVGPVASGDKVIEDEAALAKLCELSPKLVAVEMEAAGTAAAAIQAADSPGFLMIRAISDLADKQKNAPSTVLWRQYACELVASYTRHFLRSGPVPFPLPESPAPETSGAPGLPIADPNRFAVALAHLCHDEDEKVGRLIVEALRDLRGIQVLVFDRNISPEGSVPEEAEKVGHEQAQALLRQSGASVLIWGIVLSHGQSTAPRLFWTTTASGMRSKQPYLPQNFQLPEIFWGDLAEVLRLVVMVESAKIVASRGHHVGADLTPFIGKVQRLLEGSERRTEWTDSARAEVTFICAMALEISGEHSGSASQIEQAVSYYRRVQEVWAADSTPTNWAVVQNNLGVALGVLGTFASDPNRLEEAARAFRDLLRFLKGEVSPFLWAAAQSNLGNALLKLGERESGTDMLEAAIDAYRQSLRVWTREQSPLDWATVQNNIGVSLQSIGLRKADTKFLKDAVELHRKALEEWPRERVPMFWAQAQSNLGNALNSLGEREGGTELFEESVAAYQQALQERAFVTDPVAWAETQNNLGNALLAIGDRKGDIQSLKDAVTALRNALSVRTRDHVPMSWASSQSNLGVALIRLGEHGGEKQHFEEAISAIRGSLEEWKRDRTPSRWATAQHNLGDALVAVGRREVGSAHLEQAVTAYQQALEERRRQKEPLLWAATQSSLGFALHLLGERDLDTGRLENAERSYRGALEEFTEERAPFERAGVQFKLGETLRLMGQWKKNLDLLCEALEYHAAACRACLRQTPYWAFRAARAAQEDLAALKKTFMPSAYEIAAAKHEWVLTLPDKHEGHRIALSPRFKVAVAGKSGDKEPHWNEAPRRGDRIRDGSVIWQNDGAISHCLECNVYLEPPANS